MASTFKSLTPNDKISTKTLLHEAIPITGTIVSGTYSDNNIKNFSHGMFQSVYDYPYLSSSANHIFDITVGFANASSLSASTTAAGAQRAKKINIYNQMSQVLMGYDSTGSIQQFDEDGDIAAGGTKMKECIFVSFSRLLVKDEIKKNSFSMELGVGSDYSGTSPFAKRIKVYDTGADTSYKINSPVGEYGILIADTTDGGTNLTDDDGTLAAGQKCGLIFYQAGVAVLSGSVFGAAANAATATFSVAAHGSGNGMTKNQKVGIIDFSGRKVEYIVTDTGNSGAATGTALTNGAGNVGGGTTAVVTSGFLGCAVGIDISSATQENFLEQLEIAIEGSTGHEVSATDHIVVTEPSNGNRLLTQASAAGTHHLGNTVVTNTVANLTAPNFSGGGSGGILATSVGAPKMASDASSNSFLSLMTGSSISGSADALRHRIYNVSFNNTVELNSTIYFCRINHNEFNYSSNPTYLSASQIVVKTNSTDTPISYITSVGLYSSDNQLLAVGKLSEPLRKDPTIEYTLRARLDY